MFTNYKQNKLERIRIKTKLSFISGSLSYSFKNVDKYLGYSRKITRKFKEASKI